ncbi:hypothetical protein GOODEAATRI_006286 [Goodea atripinnis]|uniref:Uncharacterized protein n=1 Tax=Goodea atripinnis TaxID=208336 RepID=A0ABV0N8L9_9TELE
MKKRYVDANRLRKTRRLKITEKLSESAYTFLKFMVMWTLVLLADFILEFRLEYLWPCWLFFGSVYTTFHCHGLVRTPAVRSHILYCSKWKIKPESGQYQCQNGAMVAHDDPHSSHCLQIRSEERATEKASQEVRSAESNRQPPPPSSSSSFSKIVVAESKDQLHRGEGGPESSTTPEKLPQEDPGSKATRAAKSSSPKARRGSTNTPSPPAGRAEKKQRTNSKTISPNRDAADKSATATQNYHAEQISK